METQKDFEGKPLVRMCATCQQINKPGMEAFGLGVDQKVKDEMKEVDKKIKENSNNFNFSHGMCNPHYIQTYQQLPNMTPERLESIKEKLKHNNPIPCLLQDESLRHAYMKGLFTPEQISQATQAVKKSNQNLKERFKILAGISS